MNILFLDIDGVLNSKQWHSSDSCKALGNSVKRYFDPVCMKYLNSIISETEARVIISSSWRILRSLQDLQDLFKSVGFTGKIYGMTPDLSIFQPDSENLRGLEIQQWITNNQRYFKTAIQYIILDDEDGFLENQQQYFFQINSDIGLNDSLTGKIISFFK